MEPTIQVIFDKIQHCLENYTDETKDQQAHMIENYAKLVQEMIKYAET